MFKLGKSTIIKWVAAILFAYAAWHMATIVPTVEIAWVSGILILTIYLFSFEIIAVDEAAISIMVMLGVSNILAPIMGLEAVK